jgi:hypothetical protein
MKKRFPQVRPWLFNERNASAFSLAQRLPKTGRKFQAACAAANDDDLVESLFAFRPARLKRDRPGFWVGKARPAHTRLSFPACDIELLWNGFSTRRFDLGTRTPIRKWNLDALKPWFLSDTAL